MKTNNTHILETPLGPVQVTLHFVDRLDHFSGEIMHQSMESVDIQTDSPHISARMKEDLAAYFLNGSRAEELPVWVEESPMMARIGERVVVVSSVSLKDRVVRSPGSGFIVYGGPGFENPRIEFDSGEVFQGLDCWWWPQPEAFYKRFPAPEWKLVRVSVNDWMHPFFTEKSDS